MGESLYSFFKEQKEELGFPLAVFSIGYLGVIIAAQAYAEWSLDRFLKKEAAKKNKNR